MAHEYDIRPPGHWRKKWSELSRSYKLSLARQYDTRPKQERRKAPLFTLPARDRATFKKPEYRTPTERRYIKPQRSTTRRTRPGEEFDEYELRESYARSKEETPRETRRKELGDNKLNYGYDLDEFENLDHQEGYSYYAIYTVVAGGNYKNGFKMVMGPVSDNPDDLIERINDDLEQDGDLGDPQIAGVTVYANPTRGDIRTFAGRYPTEQDINREAAKRDTRSLGGGEKWIRYGSEPLKYSQEHGKRATPPPKNHKRGNS